MHLEMMSGGVFIALLAILTILSSVSDAQYDASVLSYLSESNLKTQALNKLGVDEDEVKEIDPIILGGYDFDGADKFKKGGDGIWRTNIYKVVMLFFSQNEMHAYTI